MKTFNDHLNESKSKVPAAVKEFESIISSKALNLKYVFQFADEKINDNVLVTFDTSSDKFVIEERAQYFKMSNWVTSDAVAASNFVRLYMISKKFNNRKLLDVLKWLIDRQIIHTPIRVGIPWKELAPVFLEKIIEQELKLKEEEYEELGITKAMRLGKRYGI